MGKQIIRTSDRYTFRTCRLLWDWSSKIRQNLEPSERYAPFEDGTSWHEALATYYDPRTWHLLGNPTTAPVVRQAARERLVAVHNEAVGVAVDLNGGSLPVETEQEYAERLDTLLAMLDHYFIWAPSVDRFIPVKIEIEFEVPIYVPDTTVQYAIEGEPVFYQGRLDGLVQDYDDRYWILEHKTAGQFGQHQWLEVDTQIGSYAWAIQEQLGVQVAGILYNQALKKAPQPPQMLAARREGRLFSVNKQQRTTYELYRLALEEAGEPLERYGEFLAYLKDQGNPFFRRLELYRNQASLKYVGHNIYLEAREMLNDPVIFPSPTFFNCNNCRFREPCISKQNGYDFQFILDELYQKRGDS